MNNFNNVIPINRKSAGATAGGKKVGGQFAAVAHQPSPIRLGRHSAEHSIPTALLMAPLPGTELPFDLERTVRMGANSEDIRFYEETFVQALPHLNPGEATEDFLRAVDHHLDGGDITELLQGVADKNTFSHPGGALADGYTPPEPTTSDRGTRMHPVVTGSKYTEQWRDVAAIAKDVRVDLKEAAGANYLPKGLSYSVRISKFAGGQSLDVTVMGLADEDRCEPVLTDRYGQPLNRPEAIELTKRVEAIAGAFNREDRDNFSTLYYCNVRIETDRDRAFREREAASRKAARA